MQLYYPKRANRDLFSYNDRVYHKKFGFGTYKPLTLVRSHEPKRLMRVKFDSGMVRWVEVKKTARFELSIIEKIKTKLGFELK